MDTDWKEGPGGWTGYRYPFPEANSVPQGMTLASYSNSIILIPNLTALENVELALQICKDPMDAADVLEEVGVGGAARTTFRHGNPEEEQQRVSIARALAKNRKLCCAARTTGALDYNTGKAILKLLQDTCRNKGMTVILITHNSATAPMADRVDKD